MAGRTYKAGVDHPDAIHKWTGAHKRYGRVYYYCKVAVNGRITESSQAYRTRSGRDRAVKRELNILPKMRVVLGRPGKNK